MLYNSWALLYSICYITLCRVLYKGWESLYSICYIAMPSCYIAYPDCYITKVLYNMLYNTHCCSSGLPSGPCCYADPGKLVHAQIDSAWTATSECSRVPRGARGAAGQAWGGPERAEPRRRRGASLHQQGSLAFRHGLANPRMIRLRVERLGCVNVLSGNVGCPESDGTPHANIQQ